MSVPVRPFVENAGPVGPSLKSLFPNLPMVEELCNKFLENFAAVQAAFSVKVASMLEAGTLLLNLFEWDNIEGGDLYQVCFVIHFYISSLLIRLNNFSI